jgi:hypothetical protein
MTAMMMAITIGDYHMLHCKRDQIYVFPEMKLRGLVPNSYIHVSVSDSYVPTIGTHILLVDQSWEYITCHDTLSDTLS